MHPSDASAFFAIKANPIYFNQACRYILHTERMQKKLLTRIIFFVLQSNVNTYTCTLYWCHHSRCDTGQGRKTVSLYSPEMSWKVKRPRNELYVITSLHIFDQSLNHVTPHFNIALSFVNYEWIKYHRDSTCGVASYILYCWENPQRRGFSSMIFLSFALTFSHCNLFANFPHFLRDFWSFADSCFYLHNNKYWKLGLTRIYSFSCSHHRSKVSFVSVSVPLDLRDGISITSIVWSDSDHVVDEFGDIK